MELKVIRIGSSIGVVIPKPIAQERGIKVGDKLPFDSNQIRMEPINKKPAGNPELAAWAEDAVERYRPALEALKDK